MERGFHAAMNAPNRRRALPGRVVPLADADGAPRVDISRSRLDGPSTVDSGSTSEI
jgi:hypothetical protein